MISNENEMLAKRISLTLGDSKFKINDQGKRLSFQLTCPVEQLQYVFYFPGSHAYLSGKPG